MSKNKKELIKSISNLTTKDDTFYLYKGLVSNLNPLDASELMIHSFKTDSLKQDILLKKIQNDLGYEFGQSWSQHHLNTKKVNTVTKNQYIKIFIKFLKLINKTNIYSEHQFYAKFLYRTYEAMPVQYQNKLVKYFVSSRYSTDHKRALEIINKNWDDSYSQVVIDFWSVYQYETALLLVINKVSDKFFDSELLNSIFVYFKESSENGDFEYNFKLRKLRNKFYSRFYKNYNSEINLLKKTEPISFIDINRCLKKKIDKDFAIKIYKENKSARRYLPNWYAEMDMLDVLSVLLLE